MISSSEFMVDWSRLPDLGAVALLTSAFAAAARRSQPHVSSLWLIGWMMIALHFAALIFSPLPGLPGEMASFIAVAALTWAAVLFTRAAVPDRHAPSALCMLATLLGANALYIGVITFAPHGTWALIPAALLLGAGPLSIALLNRRQANQPLRWMVVLQHCMLSGFLLTFQQRPGNGTELALYAVLFSAYFGCSLHFLYAYHEPTAGVFIATAGFLSWALVFVAAPLQEAFLPSMHMESGVWNLPKYVVAVGMILLILEQQIEHNKYLALHDDLTGLPNRRLFQDRLNSALERACRSGSHAALLLIDLDHFKQVNDAIGHHIGDLVLRRASDIFLGRVRRSDTVARTGGDEFSIILEGPTSRAEAELVGRSLMQLLREPMQLEGHVVRVGASVGIALFPEDAPTAEELRIAADLHMYERKYRTRTGEDPCSRSLPSVEAPSGAHFSAPHSDIMSAEPRTLPSS